MIRRSSDSPRGQIDINAIMRCQIPGKSKSFLERCPGLQEAVDDYYETGRLNLSNRGLQKYGPKLPADFWRIFASEQPITVIFWEGFSVVQPGMEEMGPIAQLTVISVGGENPAIDLSRLRLARDAVITICGPGKANCFLPPWVKPSIDGENVAWWVSDAEYGLLRRLSLAIPELPERSQEKALEDEVEALMGASVQDISNTAKICLLGQEMDRCGGSTHDCRLCAEALASLAASGALTRFELVLLMIRLMTGIEGALRAAPKHPSKLLALCMNQRLLDCMRPHDQLQWYTSILRRVGSITPLPPEDVRTLQELVRSIETMMPGADMKAFVEALANARMVLSMEH